MTDKPFLEPLHITDTLCNLQIEQSSIDWYQSYDMDYETAVDYMTNRALSIRNKTKPECVWFVEHPALYTGGTSAKGKDLINPQLPVHQTGRGGQYTYHGPGQRTIYIMLDLGHRDLGIREYVRMLEQWVIDSLAQFNIKGERRCGRVGIWVDLGDGYEDKVCAIGVRVKKWVSFHGIALNINPNLQYYNDIVPCGITEQKYGVTSFEKLNATTDINRIDTVLVQQFLNIFA